MTKFETRIVKFVEECESSLAQHFKKIDDIALQNFERIISSMQKHKLAARHFAGTTGYGYDDGGRQLLNLIFADALECEAAFVAPQISSGTQALTAALFGVLRPGDKLLSVSGEPYDTLQPVIKGEGIGSLRDFAIDFDCISLLNNNFDFNSIETALKKSFVKMILVQRSRGYAWREPLTLLQIEQLVSLVKRCSPKTIVFVDNCYGEFVDTHEPSHFGVDLMAGSLIKNPGGGFAPTGGYIAGKRHLVELSVNRLNTPSTGSETGSYYCGYLPFFQGLFQAPHTVAQAVKGGLLFISVLEKLGYKTLPKAGEMLSDIICSVELKSKQELVSFCRAIQAASPVDSFVVPEPWDMPGYDVDVIMAAGCFIQGSSIELSCDAPMKEPYIAYLQGGLSFEHIKYALYTVLHQIMP